MTVIAIVVPNWFIGFFIGGVLVSSTLSVWQVIETRRAGR
jgi:hypothetical protein